MKVIVYDMNWRSYNLNLTLEQIDFAKWLVNEEILVDVKVIDEMTWEEIEYGKKDEEED